MMEEFSFQNIAKIHAKRLALRKAIAEREMAREGFKVVNSVLHIFCSAKAIPHWIVRSSFFHHQSRMSPQSGIVR